MFTNEGIIYLLRKTSLTREEIGKLHPLQFAEILNEVYYQESLDKWDIQHGLAVILAAIYNTIPRGKGSRPLTSKDFLTMERPDRKDRTKDMFAILAEQANIILPKE